MLRALAFLALLVGGSALYTKDGACVCSSSCQVYPDNNLTTMCWVVDGVPNCKPMMGMAECMLPAKAPLVTVPTNTAVGRGGVVTLTLYRFDWTYSFNITAMHAASGWSMAIRTIGARDDTTKTITWAVPTDLPWTITSLTFKPTVENDPAFPSSGIPGAVASNATTITFVASGDTRPTINVVAPVSAAFVEEGKPFTLSLERGTVNWSSESAFTVMGRAASTSGATFKLTPANPRDAMINLTRFETAPGGTLTAEFYFPLGSLGGSTAIAGKKFWIFFEGASADLKGWTSPAFSVNDPTTAGQLVILVPPATSAVSFANNPIANGLTSNSLDNIPRLITFDYTLLNANCNASSSNPTRIAVVLGSLDSNQKCTIEHAVLQAGNDAMGVPACRETNDRISSITVFYPGNSTALAPSVTTTANFCLKIRLASGFGATESASLYHAIQPVTLTKPSPVETNIPSITFKAIGVNAVPTDGSRVTVVGGSSLSFSWEFRNVGTCSSSKVIVYLAVPTAVGLERIPITITTGNNVMSMFDACNPENANQLTGGVGSTLTPVIMPLFQPRHLVNNARLHLEVITGSNTNILGTIPNITLTNPETTTATAIADAEPMITISKPVVSGTGTPSGVTTDVTFTLSPKGFVCSYLRNGLLFTLPISSRINLELRIPMANADGVMTWQRKPLMPVGAALDGTVPACMVDPSTTSNAAGPVPVLTTTVSVELPAFATDVAGAMLVVQVTSGSALGIMGSSIFNLVRNTTAMQPAMTNAAFAISNLAVPTAATSGSGVAFSLNSAQTVTWSSPGLDCSSTSTTQSKGSLFVVIDSVEYALRSNFPMCYEGAAAMTKLEHVMVDASGLTAAAPTAKLVLKVISGLGIGEKASLDLNLGLATAGALAVRFVEPAPVATFPVMPTNPVLNAKAGTAVTLRWALTGAGITCTTASGTMVLVWGRYPEVSYTVSADGILTKKVMMRFFPISMSSDGKAFAPVAACTEGSTPAMSGTLTWNVPLASLPNVTNAEIIVASAADAAVLTAAASSMTFGSLTKAVLTPITISGSQMVWSPPTDNSNNGGSGSDSSQDRYKPLWITDPKPGQMIAPGAILNVRWMANSTLLDCSTAAPGTVLMTERTGRSYVRFFLASPMAKSFSDSSVMPIGDGPTGVYLACDSTSGGAANITLPSSFPANVQFAMAVVSGKGSASTLDLALSALLNGTLVRDNSNNNNAGTSAPPDQYKPLWITQPVSGQTINPGGMLWLRWTANTTQLDCSSQEPKPVIMTAMEGRSYVRVYVGPAGSSSFMGDGVMPVPDPMTIFLACDSMGRGGANISLPLALVPSTKLTMALVVVSGKGAASSLDMAAMGGLQGDVTVGSPIISDPLSVFMINEPKSGDMVTTGKVFPVRWSIDVPSLFDCSSSIPSLNDLSGRVFTGRSMVRIMVGRPGVTTSASTAVPLAGFFPACGPNMMMMGGANVSFPTTFSYGNYLLAVLVVSGKGAIANIDNSTGGFMDGVIQLAPPMPPSLEFVFPGPSDAGLVFSAATTPKITLKWNAKFLDCDPKSPFRSRVGISLTSNVPGLYGREVASMIPACDSNGVGSFDFMLPMDLPNAQGVTLLMAVMAGFGAPMQENGPTVNTTSIRFAIRGNRGITITSPSAGNVVRIPRRTMMMATTSNTMPNAIAWNAGFLRCKLNGGMTQDPADIDKVAVVVFKESEYNATLSADVLVEKVVWSYMTPSGAPSVPACVSNTVNNTIVPAGIQTVDLPPNMFMPDTRYVLVISVTDGPNAGLTSDPVPFTVVKPFIAQIRPPMMAASSGAPSGLAWTAMGLASDEMCRITIRKGASVYLLTTVKCADNKAGLILAGSAINAAGVVATDRIPIPVGTGYAFDVALLEADGKALSTIVSNSTMANFEVLEGASIKPDSLVIRNPSTTNPSMPAESTTTSANAGSRIFVSWTLQMVPEGSPLMLSVCYETTPLFKDSTGAPSNCGVVFRGSAPLNRTVLVIPINYPTTSTFDYQLKLEVGLTALGSILEAVSPKFAVAAPSLADARFAITSPLQAISGAIGQSLNVTWRSAGLGSSVGFLVELLRARDMMVVANLSNNSPVAVSNMGMCDQATLVCMGGFLVDSSAADADMLLPGGIMKDSFLVCVRHPTAMNLRDCSAPISIYKEAQPTLMITARGESDVTSFGLPLFKVGNMLVIEYTAQAVPDIMLALVSSSADIPPIPITRNGIQLAPSGANGKFSWQIPTDFVTAVGGEERLRNVLFFVKARGIRFNIDADSQVFSIAPANGILTVRSPIAGSSFEVLKPLVISWNAIGLSRNLTIKLFDAATEPMMEVATIASNIPWRMMSYVWPGPWVNETALGLTNAMTSRRLVIRLLTDDLTTLKADSGSFVVQKPAMRIESVMGLFSNGTMMPMGGTTVRLGDVVMVSWRTIGLDFGATATLALVPSDLMTFADAMAAMDRVRIISQSVQVGSTTMFRFPLTGMFKDDSSYRMWLVLNGADGNVIGMSPTPGFKVALPQDGFALFLTLPSAADGGAFILGASDAPLSFNWVTKINGAEDASAGTVTITLENRLMPGWMRPVLSQQSGTQSATFVLPTDLDISPGVASAYFLRAYNSQLKLNSTSPLFMVMAPQAVISVMTPIDVMDSTQPIPITFTVSKLPGMTANENPRVNVSIAHAFIRGPLASSTVSADPSRNNEVSLTLPAGFKVPVGGERAFFVVVRSVQFPSVGGSSAAFGVKSLDEPAKLMITSIVGGSTTTAGSTAGPVTAVLKDTDVPTLMAMVTNPGTNVKVSIMLMNARNSTFRKPVATDVAVTSGAMTFPLANNPLANLPDAMDPARRDFFFFSFMSTQQPMLNVNSTFFTVSPSTVVLIRLLSPVAPMTRVAGESIVVKWASIGLASTATVTLELINGENGMVAISKEGLSASDEATMVLDAEKVPASMFYYVRAKASTTVFAQSPFIAVMAKATVSVSVQTPNAATTALTGQPLDISWRAFAPAGYSMTISLVNELINNGDPIMRIAEGLTPSSTGKFTWIVPTTVRTSLDVRRSYSLRFSLFDTANNNAAFDFKGNPPMSQTFTIATREAFVSVIAPMAGDVFTLGDNVKIAWAARNIRNGLYRVGLVNDGLKALWILNEAANVTNFDVMTGSSSGSYGWMIPTTLPVTPSASSLWFIVVTPLDNPTVSVRAGPFTIRSLGSPYVVLAPRKDFVASNGTGLTVTFTMSSDAAASEGASKVNVTLCNRASTAELLLASGTSSTNLSVLIPSNVPTGSAVRSSYFIRVSPFMTGTGFTAAESDVFTITAQSNVIRVLSPQVGSSFTRGDRINVAWMGSKSLQGTNVRVEIFNTRTLARAVLGISSVGVMMGDSLMNDGAFAVPASLPIPLNKDDAGRFVIRVISTADESVNDMSPRFNLSLPSQVIRVFRSSADIPPAPMSGGKVAVSWAALGFPSDGKVSIFLRNATADSATADDSNLMAVATAGVGRAESCAVLGFAGTTTADAGALSFVCGTFDVPVDDMQALSMDANNKPVSWSIVVRSSDDAAVSGQTRNFIVRPKVDSLAATITKPMFGNDTMGFVHVVGSVLPVTWTSTSTAAVKVELFCLASSGGEVLIATIASSVALNAGKPATDFKLMPSQLMGEEKYSRCFVQLTSLNVAANANAAVMRSPLFPIRMPSMGVSLVKPAPQRTTLSAASLSVSSGATETYLSGQGLDISWSFMATEIPASSYQQVMITLRRVNLAEGTSEGVFTFWPSPTAKLGEDGMSLPAASNMIPDTLPFGLYSIQISAFVAGVSRVFSDRSAPFFVRPFAPTLSIVEPKADMNLDAGGLLRIAYASSGIAASNRVMITLSQVDGNRRMVVVTNSTEASGVFQWALPVNIVNAPTKFSVRVSLLENSTIRADSDAFTVKPKPRYISVDWPAPAADGTLPVWKAEEQVMVKFTVAGFSPNVTSVAVELWQDRFFVAGGGDRRLAVLASSVPLTGTDAMKTGSLSLPVPSDIDSTAMVYVVVKPTDASVSRFSGRSKPFPIRSAPVPGLQEFLAKLCDNVWTASAENAAKANPPSWLNNVTKAFCAKSCSQCTTEFGGVWMPAVTVNLDFAMNWLGGQRDLRFFKNLLGAFQADGSNICFPQQALANSTVAGSSGGSYSFSFAGVPYYDELVKQGSAARVNMTMPRLTASQVVKPLMSCTAVQPVAKSTFSIPNVDPSSLTPAALEDLIKKIKADIVAKLNNAGISALESDITVNFDAASGSSSSSSSAVRVTGGRRLQSSSGSTSGSVATTTSSDSDANAAGASMGGGSSSVPGMTTGDASVSTTSQQQGTGTSGGTSSGYTVTSTDGSTSKAPSADDNSDQITSAFSTGGLLDLLAQVAKNRDVGVSAITGGGAGGPSPSPAPGATPQTTTSNNTAAIVGGVIGALCILGVLGALAVYTYNKNQMTKRGTVHNLGDGGAGTGLHNPMAGKVTSNTSFGNANNGAKATNVNAGGSSGDIAMMNNPLKFSGNSGAHNALSTPSNNRVNIPGQTVGSHV